MPSVHVVNQAAAMLRVAKRGLIEFFNNASPADKSTRSAL
jgi:hypothetical protein